MWNLDLENLLTLGCGWLQDYLRFHPESLEELEPCQTPTLLLAAPDSFVTQGEKLAQAGDFERAIEKFKKANSWKPKLVLNPEIKAAPAYVTQGEEKAKNGDFPGAVAIPRAQLKILKHILNQLIMLMRIKHNAKVGLMP